MSNNGSQHLSALTRDEITAPHVNLVPLELPGDLYKYVAEHVWDKIKIEVDAIPQQRRKQLEEVVSTIIDFKTQIAAAIPGSERRNELTHEIVKYKKSIGDDLRDAAPVFWNRITDNKHRRKICKRNVMTLPLKF